MKNKLINIVLVLLCLAVGFAVGMQVFGPKDRTYTVKNGDSFYAQPSVTAAVCTDSFALGQQLEVIGRVEFTKPTAVKLNKELLLDGEDKLKYKLHKGGVYKVAEAVWIRRILPACWRLKRCRVRRRSSRRTSRRCCLWTKGAG